MAKKAQVKKTTKSFWDKLEYWKRGGLIGIIFGLFLFIILHNHYFKNISLFVLVGVTNQLFPLFIIEVILPLIYGSIMGSVYNRTSKTKFLIILLITGVLLTFLIAILVLSIAKPY